MMRALLAGTLLFFTVPAHAAPAPASPPTASSQSAVALSVLPASATLVSSKASQRFILEGTEGGFASDLSTKAKWSSSNPKIVHVDPSGVARPVGDGVARVVAVVDGRKAMATVRVRAAAEPLSWSFANHVLPVLTKSGCNSGACHGAAAGKGGLKLTLRGYDPQADFDTLTRQALGRRIVPADPAQSLLLQKPTMGVMHAGGLRFKANSPEYGIIAQWIAQGAAPPSSTDAKLLGLEVYPREAVLKPGAEQQLIVRARFDDGRVEDVTRWVKYGASDVNVATVDDDGHVAIKGEGEAAITLLYLSKVAFARVAVPFHNPGAAEAIAKSERRNFVDELVLKKLQALQIPPSAGCTDAQFIRRAYLDAAGILPTPEEVQAFVSECEAEKSAAAAVGSRDAPPAPRNRGELAGTKPASQEGGVGKAVASTALNPSPKAAPGSDSNSTPRNRGAGGAYLPPAAANGQVAWKARDKLVDRLLQRPEFTDYWAYKWSDLLLVSSRRLPSKGVWTFYNWIRESVAENKPWDRFTREILTANGSTLTNGAANYWVLHKDPIDLTETTSQAFLGMALTCGRCHNHPLEKWTLNDYYGMANLFARVRLKSGDLPGEYLVFASDSGDVPHIRSGMPVPPRPLDGKALSLNDPSDRREALAQWLTSGQNPYFARALVNRVWRNFMGRGLVEAEDDLRLTNPPSNEELLSALAADFVKGGFDVKRLIRTIITSAAYGRSADPVAGNEKDGKYYSTYIPRRLPAEVMLDVLSQVTGVPTDFPGYPRGYRALQLPDSTVASNFLTAFGRAPRVQTCSCERQEEPTVAQALHLSNGDTLNGKLRAPGGTVERLLKEGLTDAQLLDRVYLLAYGRKPAEKERGRVLEVLKRYPAVGPARREAVEDVLSALLTSKEFLFNH